MAVLIPSDLANSKDARPHDIYAGDGLRNSMPDDTWIWYNSPDHSDRPRFVLISPHNGVVAIDVYDWAKIDIEAVESNGLKIGGESLVDPVADLGRRIESIRKKLEGISSETLIQGFIVLTCFKKQDLPILYKDGYLTPDLVISGDMLVNGALNGILRKSDSSIDSSLFADIREKLYPETQFLRPRLIKDEEASKRRSVRVQLDQEQESLARSMESGVTILSGVCGSGKTLVLCARARLLAVNHPDWDIQILCYNRSLVKYLSELIGDKYPNLRINTYFSWLKEVGVRMPWGKKDELDLKLSQNISFALDRDVAKESYDAILIDEGQDFSRLWLDFAISTVRKNRGGLLIATDDAQRIYREEDLSEFTFNNDTRCIHLDHNYRNTGNIGQFAIDTVFGESKSSLEKRDIGIGRVPLQPKFRFEGPCVQMVWAENWDSQAEFIVKQIQKLTEEGHAEYRDIAILYTQRMGTIKRILYALDSTDIPYYWGSKNKDTKSCISLAENSVKLLTVHSAKGLEFPFVFIFGVEALRVPDMISEASEEEANRTRIAYVGMTRAQDRLYLTYTRTNPIIERAFTYSETCDFQQYPEDYDF